MISSKTVGILLFIILNMQLVASTSPSNIQGPDPHDKPVLKKRKRCAFRAKKNVLVDTTSKAGAVESQDENTEEMSTVKESLVGQSGTSLGFFETLMNKGRYKRMCYFAKRIGNDKFLKRICLIVKTFEQYNGIVGYLKQYKMVALFYIHGNIGVVKEAIAKSGVYVKQDYVGGGDLEVALHLSLNEDRHDRIIELLNVRREITGEEGEQSEKLGNRTSFEYFVFHFLHNLAPWKDGMALRRFLTHRGDELRDKYPDILNAFCQALVYLLKNRPNIPKAENLLADLIGQPSLLTSVVFTTGILIRTNDGHRSLFIKHAWDEAVEECLNRKYLEGGDELWRVMKEWRPSQFSGDYPSTPATLGAVLAHFPTKHKLEEDWNKKCVAILFNKLKCLGSISNILPTVLWPIIAEYAVSLTVTEDLTTVAE